MHLGNAHFSIIMPLCVKQLAKICTAILRRKYLCLACTGVIAIGIGCATAKFLAKCGADVIALSRTQADLDSLKKEVQRFGVLAVADS